MLHAIIETLVDVCRFERQPTFTGQQPTGRMLRVQAELIRDARGSGHDVDGFRPALVNDRRTGCWHLYDTAGRIIGAATQWPDGDATAQFFSA